MLKKLFPLMLVLTVSGCVTHAATSGRVVLKGDDTVVDVRIGDADRALIEDYYRKSKKKKGLPPGLAKRGGDLPPGLAKRDTLPPGLSGEPLPAELEAKLSRLPLTYVRVKVGRDVVLMDKKTRVVFDVIYGIGD
jgi:hypothetical protein